MVLTQKVLPFVTVILSIAASPAASHPGPIDDIELSAEQCRLSAGTVDRLGVKMDGMAMRFYLASLEATEDPDQFADVRRELTVTMDALAITYGRTCIETLDTYGLKNLWQVR